MMPSMMMTESSHEIRKMSSTNLDRRPKKRSESASRTSIKHSRAGHFQLIVKGTAIIGENVSLHCFAASVCSGNETMLACDFACDLLHTQIVMT